MEFLKGKVVVSDGILYADGVFFLAKETIKENDMTVKEALSDLYDIVSNN